MQHVCNLVLPMIKQHWIFLSKWIFEAYFICYNDLPLVFQQAALPQGKVIGGTFAMNEMIYQRGRQDIFNEWEVKGAKGWGLKNVLPYFVKSVDTKVPELSNSGKTEKKD